MALIDGGHMHWVLLAGSLGTCSCMLSLSRLLSVQWCFSLSLRLASLQTSISCGTAKALG